MKKRGIRLYNKKIKKKYRTNAYFFIFIIAFIILFLLIVIISSFIYNNQVGKFNSKKAIATTTYPTNEKEKKTNVFTETLNSIGNFFSDLFKSDNEEQIKGEGEIASLRFGAEGELQTLSIIEDSRWYSWAKDNHNSRIADDVLTPPLNLNWSRKMPTTYNNPSRSGVNLAYENDKLFAVVTESGSYFADEEIPLFAFNATNGSFLWRAGEYGGVGSRSHIFVGGGYVWGGVDHAGGYRLNTETGAERAGYSWAESYNNIDEYGYYTYGRGFGTDGCGVSVDVIRLLNKPLVSPTPTGKFNGAYNFPGEPAYNMNGDYLNLGNILNSGNKNITIMFWFQPNTTIGSGYILYKGKYESQYTSLMKILYQNGNISYSFKPDYAGNFYGKENFSCAKNEWCHFAFSYDHEYQRVYKNGLLVYSRNQTGDIGSDSNNLYIGGIESSNNFIGTLDEFAVFDKALSSNEISNLYNSEIPNNYEGLQLLFHFNNDFFYGENETFIYDFSGNSNNAVYDGHLNLVKKTISTRQGCHYDWYSNCANCVGVYSNWGMVGPHRSGQGQIASNDGILYVPDGILWAYNVTNGSVIWRQGVWPLAEMVTNISHFSEVTYSNGVVYSIGRENNKNHTGSVDHSNGIGPVFQGNAPEWSIAKLYAYDARNGTLLFNIPLPNTNSSNWQPALYDFQVIIEDNYAYISGMCKIFKFDLNTKTQIWGYNKTNCSLYYDENPFILQVGWKGHYGETGFALSGDILYTSLRTYTDKADKLIAINKNNGSLVWEFQGDNQSNHRFSHIIISGNTLFASTFDHELYAFKEETVSFCGNGVCEAEETIQNCFNDCNLLFNITVLDESFLAYITQPQSIHDALDNYYGRNSKIISGNISRGNRGFNIPWSWHLVPDSVRMVDSAMELCDGKPSYVENNLEYWLNQVKVFCPWASRVNSYAFTPCNYNGICDNNETNENCPYDCILCTNDSDCGAGKYCMNNSCYFNEDINNDGNINVIDLVAVAKDIIKSGCNSGNNWCNRRDVNRDGNVNIIDLASVAKKI